MSPNGRLDVQPWMRDPRTQRMLNALAHDGITARFVGGCVRDALCAKAVVDVDLAIDRPPEAAVKALERARIKVVPTGLKHGTITAVAGGRPYEITTLRRDVQTDGRHAVVAFTDDWRADAARRDFTINAMFGDASGNLWDFFDGRGDLAAGRVRFVGDPAVRIDEDVLRILRFFRFYAWYGQAPVDAAGLAACRAAADKLRNLSAERVRKELLKLLEAADPAGTIETMAASGLFAHWLPEYDGTALLQRVVANERAAAMSDGLRRLAAIIGTAGDATVIGKRLRLSTQESLRLTVMLAIDPVIDVAHGPAMMRRQIYHLGNALYVDRLMRLADSGWREAYRLATTWTPPELPISGGDVLKAGVPAGRRVGALVAAVEGWWIDNDFAADRAACLAELRRRVDLGEGA
ncbi:CCA tRNA nucleotidyltransferase [Reyranella sp. CPCC 100927]|uniref:CCA tRNA nucleotidyltransferase n=1 Tax=Reyranella sp. CPCC 100927 TaxID=2599616 RepID=UPI0011B74B1D|nr:CCA tRNA nucleotidyltransferase [Reyranella sp. CPCC 100927]TWT15669.1 CCA tRNA nucleotidyltransferase [Reyranella sp. CPCC 100927]